MMLTFRRGYVWLAMGLFWIGAVQAATVFKAENTDDLNQGSSWIGGSAPSAGDIAVWSNQVTGANASTAGGALDWQGLRIASPGGPITINATAAAELTLGADGIDMVDATGNLTIQHPIRMTTPQTWGGRTSLNIQTTVTNAGHILTIDTAGTVNILASSGHFMFGGGGLIKEGSGVLIFGGGGGGGGGPTHSMTGQLWVKRGTLRSGKTNLSIGPVAEPILVGDVGTTGIIHFARFNTGFTFSQDFRLVDGGAGEILCANALNLTYSGVIDGGGDFIKTGGNSSITMTQSNRYTGNTIIEAGSLRNNLPYLDDASTVFIAAGALLELTFAGEDTVGGLVLNGVVQPDGTYGAVGSGADFESVFFVGTGLLRVIQRAIVNRPATEVRDTTARFNALLNAGGTNFFVRVFWGETDGTNNAGAWSNSLFVGAWTDVSSTNLSLLRSGLTPGTNYFYTFLATNRSTNVWATPSVSFSTTATNFFPDSELVLQKAVDLPSLTFGTSLVYTITLENLGMQTAGGVTVTDALPAAATFLWSEPPPDVPTNNPYVFSFGTLGAGAGTSITIYASVTTTTPGVMTNVATVATTNTEASLANNRAIAITTLPDSDGDGLANPGDPNDDNDLMPDCAEAIAGTNPLDADSFLWLRIARPPDDTVRRLSFPSVTGRTYRVEATTNLLTGPWLNMQTNIFGISGTMQVFRTNAANRLYYRIGVDLQ